jgi:hypothetical protein
MKEITIKSRLQALKLSLLANCTITRRWKEKLDDLICKWGQSWHKNASCDLSNRNSLKYCATLCKILRSNNNEDQMGGARNTRGNMKEKDRLEDQGADVDNINLLKPSGNFTYHQV